MYSDAWIKDAMVRKASPILLTDEIRLSEWLNEKNEPIGISIDFEYADDIHYEFLIEDWNLFISKVLKVEPTSDYIPYLKAFFQKPKSHLDFGTALWNNKIEHKKIAFY